MTEGNNFIKDPSAFLALTKIHKQAVSDIGFSPDSDQILSGSADGTVVLWNLPPNDIELHDDTINDEHKLVCYKLSDQLVAPPSITAVAIHKKIFISASKDGHCKIWKLIPDPGHPCKSHHIDANSTLFFKKPSSGPFTYNCHQRIVRTITFSHNARCFATGSDDKSVKIWSTECRNKMLVSFLDGHTNWIKCVRWAKTNDALLASCGDDGKVCIWDARIKVRQPPVEVLSTRKKTQYNCLDWHPVFEHHIATGAQDSAIAVWDLRNRKQVQVYTEHNGSVNSIAFNSGGSLLLSGSNDKTSKIFDVCEGRNMFTLMSHSEPVTSVCFNSTGDMFATGSKDKTVTVWKRNFDTIDIVLEDDTEDLEEEESNADELSDINHDDISHYANSSVEFRSNEQMIQRQTYSKKRVGR